MDIIPVIDLKGGVVVRARHGERDAYRPIETPLSATSEAVDVVAGLLALHPFRHLYVADLDAIERKGEANAIFDRLAAAFPELRVWMDNGCSDRRAAEKFAAERPGWFLVLGSESQAGPELLRALVGHPRIVLSLDFRGDAFLGPSELLEDTRLWPERLIVMTLARVGSGAGPDLARLHAVSDRADGRAICMAGGLRGRDDLKMLQAAGAAGILVASALHDGRLSPADLAEFAGEP